MNVWYRFGLVWVRIYFGPWVTHDFLMGFGDFDFNLTSLMIVVDSCSILDVLVVLLVTETLSGVFGFFVGSA